MIPVRKIALLAVVAAQVTAFADEKSDKDIQKSVVPYGLIQAYSNLADSQYGSTPDFTLATVRFGVRVSEGITRGQIETQYMGNLPETGPINSASQGLNGVLIRRADVGLALSSGTTISLGRVRLGGADAWGIDATTPPDQFGFIDGGSVVQKLSLGGKNELALSLGVGNSMGVPSGRDTHTFGRTLKSDRGVIVGARTSFEGVVAAAYYGMEKNQVRQEAAAEQPVLAADGKPLGGDSGKSIPENGSPIAYTKLKRLTTARDASHFEASLGYNKENWSFGGWYQAITLTDLKVVSFVNDKFKTSAPTADDEKFGAKASPKTTSTVVGAGFNTDSSLLGYTDVLQKGALLTMGGSLVKAATRDSDSSNDSAEAQRDQLQYALGVGYQAGGFALELGHLLATSKGENFNDRNAEQDAKPTKKSSNYTYLMGIYVF